MEVRFQNKEASNKAQEEAFLALSPSARVQAFFELMEQVHHFENQTRISQKDNKNFVIEIDTILWNGKD